MSSVETGQNLMSAVETGQMTAAETSVLSQQKKAKVQSWLTKVPVRSQIIENGPNRVQNRPFGPKQRPNESYGLCGPIRTTPEAKNGLKTQFLRKTAPGGRPAAPTPFHRSSPVWGPMQLWLLWPCLLYTSPSPRDATLSRMPSSA